MKYFIFFISILIIILYLYKRSNNLESFVQDNRIEDLRKYFSNISPQKKIFLSNQCNLKEYNRFNIEPSMENFIKNLIYPYIYNLNYQFNYDFIINKISNISEETDNMKNRRYIIDFFMYDINNYFVSRVIIDIVLFNNNTKYLNEIVFANAGLDNKKIITKNKFTSVSQQGHCPCLKIYRR